MSIISDGNSLEENDKIVEIGQKWWLVGEQHMPAKGLMGKWAGIVMETSIMAA